MMGGEPGTIGNSRVVGGESVWVMREGWLRQECGIRVVLRLGCERDTVGSKG